MEDRTAPRTGEAGRSGGARRRRRGLYGPPPRLDERTPLVGRILWHIGDWGRASEHIGSRWEEMGAELASERLSAGERLVVLAHSGTRMAEVFGSGLSHADAVRVRVATGSLALAPLDFKWSLETASVRQVSQETLQILLERGLPSMDRLMAELREEARLAEDLLPAIEPGFFVAPVHAANREALRLDPELPAELFRVSGEDFFGPLPAWGVAEALARLEGARQAAHPLEAAERYYRLGAGVAGALRRVRASLFEEEPPEVDAVAYVEALRRGTTINQIVVRLDRELAARRLQEEMLREVPRAAYPFGRLRADLARAGAPSTLLASRGALGRLYSEVMREVLAAVRAEGRELTRSGLPEPDALSRLGEQAERWATEAAAHATRLVALLPPRKHEDQGSGAPTSEPPVGGAADEPETRPG